MLFFKACCLLKGCHATKHSPTAHQPNYFVQALICYYRMRMYLWWNLCTSLTCQVSHRRQFRSLLIYSSDIFWRIKFKREVQLYLQIPMFLQMSKYIACCWCCIPAHITSHAMRRIHFFLTVLWASFCFRLISTQTAPILLRNGTQKSKVVASPALHWTWAYRLALGVCLKETPKHSRNFWSKVQVYTTFNMCSSTSSALNK